LPLLKRNEIARLIRFDKPYGTLLLLFPTLWSLFIASSGRPTLKHLAVFILGSFFMRSAGCVINDMADCRLDAQIVRTRNRPLPKGTLTQVEALLILFTLLTLSFLLVLTLNWITVELSFVALLLAAFYPFAKRFTYFPQAILGISFSFGILMAWTATQGKLTLIPCLILMANLCWTIGYDTIYALMDKEEDIKIGVKSTAVFWGAKSGLAIGTFFLLTLLFLYMVGKQAKMGGFYHFTLIVAAAIFLYQSVMLQETLEREKLFSLFKAHVFIGGIILTGILSHYYIGG
jgi:4-hydroxybenzoate polyprenyltransferase